MKYSLSRDKKRREKKKLKSQINNRESMTKAGKGKVTDIAFIFLVGIKALISDTNDIHHPTL